MLKQIYVVDLVADDLGPVKVDFDRIFGTEPLWIEPEMAPGRAVNAMYYQMPGEGVGIHALGIFDRSGEGPKDVPTGAFLVGILCDDVDATVQQLRASGIQFLYPNQQRYAVGRNNITGPLNGVSYSIAQHDPSGYRVAQGMMKTKSGTSDFGDPTQSGIIRQLHLIDLVVSDINSARKSYAALFGVDPKEQPQLPASGSEILGLEFTAPGNGVGIHAVRLFSLTTDSPSSIQGKHLRRTLARRGDGIFRLGFLVSDIARTREKLCARGVRFAHSVQNGMGSVIEDLHGVDFLFEERS